MLPNELNHLVALEQHKDRLRALERNQLWGIAQVRADANRGMHRKAIAWFGGQLVRWGLALQRFGPSSPQPSKAVAATRVR